jgi:hypothetical protein
MHRLVCFLSMSLASLGFGLCATPATAQEPVLGACGIAAQHIASDVKPGDDSCLYTNEGGLKTETPPLGFSNFNASVKATVATQTQLGELFGGIMTSRGS